MSRSRRKTPICGHTTAVSEKADKASNHRRIRRQVSVVLRNDAEAEVLPHDKELSSPWLMSKDGKGYFNSEKFPELMRK